MYIGQSWNIERRFKTYRKLHCKGQSLLYKSLLKYGPEEHEFSHYSVLPDITTQEEMDRWEQYVIGFYRRLGQPLLNLTRGGIGSPGLKHTDEAKLKMSKIRKGLLVGCKNGRARSVYQFNINGELIEVHGTLTDAAKKVKTSRQGISDCVNGRNMTAGGFIWKYNNQKP